MRTLLIALIALLPSLAQAQDKPALLTFSLAATADWATTYHVNTTPRMKEDNPMISLAAEHAESNGADRRGYRRGECVGVVSRDALAQNAAHRGSVWRDGIQDLFCGAQRKELSCRDGKGAMSVPLFSWPR